MTILDRIISEIMGDFVVITVKKTWLFFYFVVTCTDFTDVTVFSVKLLEKQITCRRILRL